MTAKRALGVFLIAAGLVLILFFRDARYEWFEGGWLGLALIVLGVWDLAEDIRRTRGGRHRATLIDELRNDIRGDFGRSTRDRDERN